jgi:hypothetical protein
MPVQPVDNPAAFLNDLTIFNLSGETEHSELLLPDGLSVPVFINEFWTNKQRQADRMHEISYRACFKPQLPRFFIERFTVEGDVVFDPFLGRGTTIIEAALLGRRGWGTDVNPLSRILVLPRLHPPSLDSVEARLADWDMKYTGTLPQDLLVFFHHNTLGQICWMRDYFKMRLDSGKLDEVDLWIQMIATNRLTGHSPGFFSVYTMPPNQAVSLASQKKINLNRNQTAPERDVRKLILKKSKALLLKSAMILNGNRLDHFVAVESANNLKTVRDDSVSLVVTSPPFLDVVDYKGDNWLRCWFNQIDPESVAIWGYRSLDDWSAAMTACLKELHRVLKPGGWVAFEVGEVRKGSVSLEESVAICGRAAGLCPEAILINAQDFTKTAHCWGVNNQSKGTNTNRIVCFRKES